MAYNYGQQQQQYGAGAQQGYGGAGYPGQQAGYPPPPGGGYGAPPPPGYGQAPPPGGHGTPGGFATGAAAAPPPGADPQLWSWFIAVDEDRSGQITAPELQRALVNGDWSPFDLDTTKLLMTIFDTDRSGTIGFNEFAGLWKYIKDWQNVFRHFDADRSGSIDGTELANALRQFGYNLSPAILNLVEKKYAVAPVAGAPPAPGHHAAPHAPPAHPGARPGITFDRFVRCCVVIKQLTESFQRLDTDRDGWVQINYETFMTTVLAAP